MKRIILIFAGFVALQAHAQQLSPTPQDMAALSAAVGHDLQQKESYTAKRLKFSQQAIREAATDYGAFLSLASATFKLFGNPKNYRDYLRENGAPDSSAARLSEIAFYQHTLLLPADPKLAPGFGYGVKLFMDTARARYYVVTIAQPRIELRKYAANDAGAPEAVVTGRLFGNAIVPDRQDTTLRLFFLDGVLGEYNGSNVANEYFEAGLQGNFVRANNISAFEGIIPDDFPSAAGQVARIKMDIPPMFPGGDEALNEYLDKNLRYPEAARRKSVSANITVSFVIDSLGKVHTAKVMGQPRGHGLDEEALRLITAMPDWLPGIQNGKAVNVMFYLPVRFRP